MRHQDPVVSIRPYARTDLRLLERLLGDPETTGYIGGPETPEAISKRHARYLEHAPALGGLYTIVLGPGGHAVGWVGYWASEWQGEVSWECGWHVLPEYQGLGIATAGAALMVERAREAGRHSGMHAFPDVANEASNAVCRNLGFELVGEEDVEYPVGHTMHSNHWRLELAQAPA